MLYNDKHLIYFSGQKSIDNKLINLIIIPINNTKLREGQTHTLGHTRFRVKIATLSDKNSKMNMMFHRKK